VLPSIGNEVLKAEQLITMREQVSKDVREALTERAKSFHIKLDDVSWAACRYCVGYGLRACRECDVV
jgi:prohibitin 1